MIKHTLFVFVGIIATNSLIGATNRATICSPDLRYNRSWVADMQSTHDHIPHGGASSYWSAPVVPIQQPSIQIINNNSDSASSTGSKIKKATGIMAIIGGALAVGKYIYSYVEFGQQVVDVGNQVIDVQKKQQKLQEEALRQAALRTQAQNEVNDLNREFNHEAHEAHAAINSLSLQQLHIMAIAEEEEGSPSRYFRDRYAAAISARR